MCEEHCADRSFSRVCRSISQIAEDEDAMETS